MNQKLSFQYLASLLSEATAQPQNFSEEFIKELFAAVTEVLSRGESVKIKGLGEFSPAPEAADKLIFTPDDTLAGKVNAPFSHFSPTLLNPEVTDSQLDSVEINLPPVEEHDEEDSAEQDDDTSVENTEEDTISVSEPITVTETLTTSSDVEDEIPVFIPAVTAEEEIKNSAAEEDTIEVIESPVVPPQPSVPEIIPIEEDEEEIFDSKEAKTRITPPKYEPAAEPTAVADNTADESDSKSSGFGMGFFVGLIVGIAIGAAAMFFYATSLTPSTRTAEPIGEEEDTAALNDVIDATEMPDTAWADLDTTPTPAPEVEQQPEPQPEPEAKQVAAAPSAPVTDKVKAGYLMPKMAQKHYGNQVFWVYIYEENKTKISNPNNLTAGLELVIPAPEKYGIDANDPKSIARAQAKESEIWNKK